jgi:hypothetical protein
MSLDERLSGGAHSRLTGLNNVTDLRLDENPT